MNNINFYLHSILWLVVLLATPASRAQPAEADSAAARVTELADSYMAAYFQRNPEAATLYGLSAAQHDQAFDNSPEALQDWQDQVDRFHAALQRINADALAGLPERATYGFLRHELESGIATRVCRSELWRVDQHSGPHLILSRLASRQPVGTRATRAAALARFRQYDDFFDQEIANLREGLQRGYSAPRNNVERVVAQLDGILARTGEASPLYEPASRDSSATFQQQWLALLADSLYPALTRYRNFLRDEYLPKARTTTAVAALPDGEACYQALIQEATTLDLAPEELHKTGLQRMEKIHDDMREIAERSFGTDDVPALLERLRTEEKYLYDSAEEILAVTDSAISRAREAAPDYFGRLPEAGVVVRPFPDYQAPSAPVGRYHPPSEDGSEPGVFRINLHEPESRSRAMTEDIAFHEAIPGHHLEKALAMERTDAHPITRFLGTAAYSEGWGLYAERLANEMELYSSDLARLGMLNGLAIRAARLVVDTGVHTLGWSRQQAIDYMRQHTASELGHIESEVDRYIIEPAEATAYMTGYNEIMALRDKAQDALGEDFDLKAFHDVVLADGAVTLPMLRDKVERWIETQR